MKQCNNKNTLTVSELIERLKLFSPDLPVLATWEGQHVVIDEMFIHGVRLNRGGIVEPALVIEVDNY